VVTAFFDLADTIITARSLIRPAWTTHRWDNAPHDAHDHPPIRATSQLACSDFEHPREKHAECRTPDLGRVDCRWLHRLVGSPTPFQLNNTRPLPRRHR
jgi:hypothetical protein